MHVANVMGKMEKGKLPRLKKYAANVIGFAVGGVGRGEAMVKRPAAGPWNDTIR